MSVSRQPLARAGPTPRTLIGTAAVLVVLLAGYAVAYGQVQGYTAQLTRQQFTISGSIPTPVLRLSPAVPRSDIIAIIVHGYSGSKELMVGFGIELARIGIPSYLLDLPGHGASDVPFDPQTTDNRNPQLETALDAVVTYARAHSAGTPRIVLIGHSLGTQVVGEYALHHPTTDIAATVLISPILVDMPTRTNPAHLLILYGAGDIAGIIPRAQDLFAASCAGETPGASHAPGIAYRTCGAVAGSFTRRLAVVTGTNHITILTDAGTYRQIQAFISATLGGQSSYDPSADDGRIAWALLGVLLAFGAAFPLSALLAAGLPRVAGTAGAPPPARATWTKLGLFAASVAATVVVLRLWSLLADAVGAAGLRTPFTWLHIALADYTAAFAVVLALGLIAGHRLLRRPIPWPAVARWGWQLALAAAVGVVLYLTIGLLATSAWERLLLGGGRGWRFILIALAQVPLFALCVGLFEDESGWRSLLAQLGAFLLVCFGYVAAIALDRSLFFLSLVVPIEGLLFVAFALLNRWLAAQGRGLGLASATLMAGIFAWAVAAIFPILR